MAKDKEKKPKTKRDQLRKPSASLDFYALPPAIIEGQLVVDKNVQLVLRRARKYEMITLVRVLRTQSDGTVTLQDDTVGDQFMFNLQTDIAVHSRLRVYDKTKTKRLIRDVPLSPEAQAALDAGLASAAADEATTWNENFSQYVDDDVDVPEDEEDEEGESDDDIDASDS